VSPLPAAHCGALCPRVGWHPFPHPPRASVCRPASFTYDRVWPPAQPPAAALPLRFWHAGVPPPPSGRASTAWEHGIGRGGTCCCQRSRSTGRRPARQLSGAGRDSASAARLRSPRLPPPPGAGAPAPETLFPYIHTASTPKRWRQAKIQYSHSPKNPALQLLEKSSKSASAGSQSGVPEADLELYCNCWSAGFLGERLYVRCDSRVVHGSAELGPGRGALVAGTRNVGDPIPILATGPQFTGARPATYGGAVVRAGCVADNGASSAPRGPRVVACGLNGRQL